MSRCADQQEVGLRDTGVADDFQVSVLSSWKVGAARGCSGEDWGRLRTQVWGALGSSDLDSWVCDAYHTSVEHSCRQLDR